LMSLAMRGFFAINAYRNACFFTPNLPLWNGPLRIPVSAGEPRWAGFLCGKGSFQMVGKRYEYRAT
ncbi:hypothetical protein, partial [Escherichia coli]|uniref:hypothetical protein n=1 Tax=Escherichia coli TaxID=562 RepID=UPI001A7E1496